MPITGGRKLTIVTHIGKVTLSTPRGPSLLSPITGQPLATVILANVTSCIMLCLHKPPTTQNVVGASLTIQKEHNNHYRAPPGNTPTPWIGFCGMACGRTIGNDSPPILTPSHQHVKTDPSALGWSVSHQGWSLSQWSTLTPMALADQSPDL